MKQDKFLTGILVGVVVLVIAAVAVFLLGDGETGYLPDETPDAVVYNYVLALQTGDFERAYRYLAEEFEGETKPGFTEFRSYFAYDRYRNGSIGINVLAVDQQPDQAWVTVETVESRSGLFSEVYRSTETAILVKESNGEWKLIAMPYQFWAWEWFQDAALKR